MAVPSPAQRLGDAAHWPIYPYLLQFPVVCFSLALMTDLAYWGTAYLMWHNFSAWLLFAGVVFGGLVAVVAAVESVFFFRRAAFWPRWPVLAGAVGAFLLAVLNNFIHAGDGWTAIVPWGLTTSFLTVIVMVIAVLAERGLVPWSRRGSRHV